MWYGQYWKARALAVLFVVPLSPGFRSSKAVTSRFGNDVRAASPAPPAQEKCQLRVFTIDRGKLEAFTTAWRAGVYPLRRKHGFTVPVAWAIPETNQFVWLLCYAGPEDWEAKDKAYYASEERINLSPDPRQFIARVERWFVRPVVPEP